MYLGFWFYCVLLIYCIFSIILIYYWDSFLYRYKIIVFSINLNMRIIFRIENVFMIWFFYFIFYFGSLSINYDINYEWKCVFLKISIIMKVI